MPFTIRVFEQPADILCEKSDVPGSKCEKDISHIATLLTPTNSYSLTSFSILDPVSLLVFANPNFEIVNPNSPASAKISLKNDVFYSSKILIRA